MTTDEVRVGVVGATAYAETHMRNINSHPRAHVAAVVGLDPAQTDDVATRHAIPAVYRDYEAMLDDDAVDAVVIIAPDQFHGPFTLAALERGVHVSCEKPLATSAAEAKQMLDAARASGLVNMSFFALRSSVHHQYVRRLIDEGYLGRIYSVELSLSHGFFRGPGYQWRFDATRGGGALADLGCYLIDQARWFVGDIARVSASLTSFVERPAPDGAPYPPANDSAVLAVEFENGAHGSLVVNVVSHQAQRMQHNGVVLHGDAGSLELRHTFAGSELVGARDGEARLAPVEIPADFWGDVDPADPSTVAQRHSVGDRAFVDAILSGTQVEPSFYDGWRVQQVIEAAFEAARTGAWVPVERGDS